MFRKIFLTGMNFIVKYNILLTKNIFSLLSKESKDRYIFVVKMENINLPISPFRRLRSVRTQA